MPVAAQPSQPVLQSIADQIAERSPTVVGLAPPRAAAGPGASFRVQLLTLVAVRDGAGPLAQRLVDTGRWHHQVFAEDTPTTRAVSMAQPSPSGARIAEQSHKVVAIARSTLPAKLNATIAWINDHVAADADAEILVAPAWMLTAIWLHGAGLDSVVIAVMAQTTNALPTEQVIPGDTFLGALAAIPSIDGLAPRE